MDKILLLGDRGKMGTAIKKVFSNKYEIIGKNSSNFNVENFSVLERLIERYSPKIVINTIAFMGIDPCEKDPDKAFKINTLFPGFLASLSRKQNFLFVHFSTDAVFSDSTHRYYTEEDTPRPLNIYGLTKYGGDCLVQSNCDRFYIIRVGILFGPTSKNTQFVEKMLLKIKNREKELKIADDIISSPGYNIDIAFKIKEIIEQEYPFRLYHITNSGKASLYELMKKIITELSLDINIKKVSYKEFPHIGRKNINTPITSVYMDPLRNWKSAIKDYCDYLELKFL